MSFISMFSSDWSTTLTFKVTFANTEKWVIYIFIICSCSNRTYFVEKKSKL